MTVLARFVIAHRRWVLIAWLLLAAAGAYGAPKATSALSYDFGLPGQHGYEANQQIVRQFGSGGDNAPILLVVSGGHHRLAPASASGIASAAAQAAPGSRVVSYAGTPALLSADGKTGVVAVYPKPLAGSDAYATALPMLKSVAAKADESGGPRVVVTGEDALATGGGGGSNVLIETLFGGVGALVVLVLVFGSFLAVMPLIVAGVSILTTFLIVWGLTGITDVSFIVQYLLSLDRARRRHRLRPADRHPVARGTGHRRQQRRKPSSER